jgi:excisionase family DNA binding protein
LLSIGVSNLYKLLRSGDVASFKIGNARRIPFEALEHYVLHHSVAAEQREPAA